MIRNFFRHLGESFKSLKRNGWMTFAATFTVTISLILVGFFASVMANSAKLSEDMENSVTITAFLLLDSEDAHKQITDDKGEKKDNPDFHKVFDQITSIDGVKGIEYKSKIDTYQEMVDQYGEQFEVFGEDNPYYDTYTVTVEDASQLDDIAKQIGDISGIDDVQYGKEQYETLNNLTRLVRTWGSAITIILFVVAILLISNTIRITIMARSEEIQIMRLVGAKNSYIRAPFLFEGAWIGLLGTVLPGLLMFWLYNWIFNQYNADLLQTGLSMFAPKLFIPSIIGIMAAVGIIIGVFGSGLSMRRFLKI